MRTDFQALLLYQVPKSIPRGLKISIDDSTRAIEKSLPTRTGLQAGPLFFFLVRRGMGYAHTSPHQKENERAAGASFNWP